MSAIKEGLRAIGQLLADMPRRAEVSMLTWARSFHLPDDIGDPGAPHPFCLDCMTDWPCEKFAELDDKIKATHGEQP